MTLCATAEEVAHGADAVVLVTEWPEYRELDWAVLAPLMQSKVVLDGRNILDRAKIQQAGIKFLSIAG
ncbi:MAG: UDP-glucose/GDP-mannose dehydrogenase family protein [Acidobacteriota bacterium]